MENNTQHSKLDETIKQRLHDYQGSFESADWSRMERMLDAAPRSTSFKWNYVLNGVIGVAVLTGIYMSFQLIRSSDKKETTTAPETEQTPTEQHVVTTAPIQNNNVEVPVVVNETPQQPVVSEEVPANSGNTTTNALQATTPVNKSTQLAIDPAIQKKKKDSTKNPGIDPEELKNVRVVGMGNEPVFGDMLDSSKGIISETKEKKELKEAAKKSKSLPVGWDSFMLSNVNPDSIKSYRERMKSDSLKTE